VDTGCENLTCQPGQICVKGTRTDACQGVVCPGKAACVDGMCQSPLAEQDPNGTGGSNSVGGGIVIGPTAGALSFSDGGASSSAGTGGNSSSLQPILKSGDTATGCNCRAAGEKSSSPLAWLAAAVLAVAALRRRR
jgi:MYXO-CTERM domain-containing protein